MQKRRKLIFGVIILIFLILIILPFLIKGEAEDSLNVIPSLPSIPNGTEIIYYGYKYGNNSGYIISADNYFRCRWKPDAIDDGYKICEPIVEIENLNEIKPTINLGSVQFIFDVYNNISPIKYYFSNDSYIYDYNINITDNIKRRLWSDWQDLSTITTISTDTPFAIKSVFEIPKYEGNHYNFYLESNIVNLQLDPILTSTCGFLGTANGEYTLVNNVESSGTCFTITANNITLDCKGYYINYSIAFEGNYGVFVDGANATTVKNCRIFEGNTTGTGNYAIYFKKVSNGTIKNNTVTTYGNQGYGIVLFSTTSNINVENNSITTSGTSGFDILVSSTSDSNIFKNNNITTRGSTAAAVRFSASSNNTFEGGVIRTFNSGAAGIYLLPGSHFNKINNVITTTYGEGSYGINLDSSSNNTFSNNTIQTFNTTAHGIYVAGLDGSSPNNVFFDSFVNASHAIANDTFLDATFSNIINFTNVTLANNKIYIAGDGRLNVHWYFDSYVNDTDGDAIADANITARNVSSAIAFSQLTNINGRISRQILLEYWKNSTVTRNQNNYTFNVSKSGYPNIIRSINITTNRDEVFTLGQLTSCSTLNEENAAYSLISDVSSSGTCINITANNITLKGAGYRISYGIGTSANVYGIVTSANETIIKNVIVQQVNPTGSGRAGIYFNKGDNGTVTNVTVTTNGTAAPAIRFLSSSYVTIANSTISTTGGAVAYGVGASNSYSIMNNNITVSGASAISAGTNMNVIGNIIKVTGSGRAINFPAIGDSYSLVKDNNITATSSGYGIYVTATNHIEMVRNIINLSGGGYGIYLDIGNNISVLNATIIQSSTGGGIGIIRTISNTTFRGITTRTSSSGSYALLISQTDDGTNFAFFDSILNASSASDVFISGDANGGMWNFTNVTGSAEGIDKTWTEGANGTLNIHWYLDVEVKNATSGNPINQANVTTWNRFNNFQFSQLTDINGRIQKQGLIEYKQNNTSGSTSTYYSNYTINVSKAGYTTQSKSVNMSINRNETFNLN